MTTWGIVTNGGICYVTAKNMETVDGNMIFKTGRRQIGSFKAAEVIGWFEVPAENAD